MSDYLRRKVDDDLLNWLNNKKHSPALISGIRQCGKSRSIDEFANKHFDYVNKINFWTTPEVKKGISRLTKCR